MSRLYEALERARDSQPQPEGPPSWRRSRDWTEAAEPTVEVRPHIPEGVLTEPTPVPIAPSPRRVPRWALAMVPLLGLAAYVVVRATGDGHDRGSLRLTGVVAAEEVVVAAKAAGRIERLAVQEGSWVRAGDLVAELDQDELRAEQRHQEAVVQQLSARLRQAREVALLEADRARERVIAAEAQLKAARSQQGEAEATYDQRSKDDERARSLLESGLLARQEAERIHTEALLAGARSRAQADQVARFASDLDMARANQRQADVARSDVAQTEAEVEQANAALAQVRARLADASVRAPLRGLVSVRVAREGEVVRPGDPIVTIVDPDDVWVRAEVEESQVGRVGVGLGLDVELPWGERRRGRVTLVEPEGQFATQRDVSRAKRDIRTFGIRVGVPNADRRLHQGMTAYVWLPGRDAAPRAPE